MYCLNKEFERSKQIGV